MPVTIVLQVPAADAGAALHPIAGRPLMHWPLRAAVTCPEVGRVVLVSPSAEVRRSATLIPRVDVSEDTAEFTDSIAVGWHAAVLTSAAIAKVAAAGPGARSAIRLPSGQLIDDGAVRVAGPAGVQVEVDGVCPDADQHRLLRILDAVATIARERRLAAIRLLATDVDGTLTDGGMYYGREGEAFKRFNTRDAAGMLRLRLEHGVELGVITAEDSPTVHTRMHKLKIQRYAPGTKDKVAVLRRWCSELGIGFDQVAYIGDDFNDIPALRLAGFAACPADADPDVQVAAADLICRERGGRGAVRALADRIRAAQAR